MPVSPREVTFDACEGCELGRIIVGGDWVYAHEAVESLSSVYPTDQEGNLLDLTPNQLEEIRLNEIQEWRSEQDFEPTEKGFGQGVAVFGENP